MMIRQGPRQISFFLPVCVFAMTVSIHTPRANGQDSSSTDSTPQALPVQQPPTEDGKIRFDFAAAQWRDVLAWFADAAQLNLNWREMPEGDVNLITRGSYDIPEAKDVLNMHLLTRGFTLLERDEVLFLVKLDASLNPTMVPRVTPEELDKRGGYEYVRVTLPLDWMLAEEAAKELAPMLSPHGKIVPLTATNRIEAMDAVANLRELRNLLNREQFDGGHDRLVAEFPLRYADASEVIEKLKQLLGLASPPTRMSTDQIRLARDEMVLQTEMIKRLGDKAPKLGKKEVDVHLVANERQNSILANGAPDKIAVIRQAVQALDVPSDEPEFRLSDVTTMKVYPLNGADADTVAGVLKDLRDIGKLGTNCRYTADEDRQTLFAHASLQDHLTITSVMEQLAGSARNFQVIPLQHLQAEYVAESINAMMQGSGAANSRARNRGRRGPPTSGQGFRVEADVPGNRLFLHATDAESRQVDDLLVKLGERSTREADERVISVSVENLEETIERVRKLWPSLSSQPLHVDVPGGRESSSPRSDGALRGGGAAESDERPDVDSPTGRPFPAPPRTTSRLQDPTTSSMGQPWDLELWVSNRDDGMSLDQSSLVTVTETPVPAVGPPVGPDVGVSTRAQIRRASRSQLVTERSASSGELILRSEDRQALAQLEDLVRGAIPRSKPYTVFQLKHASPYLVEMNLREVFASDGVRAVKPLRFVADSTTQTLMVFGAGRAELEEIEELLEFYDRPRESDPETLRKPRYFELQYADAEQVANVIKDLYRDLLSANDRALAEQQGQRSQAARSAISMVPTSDKQLQFKGLLSVGTFPDTNTLIVSAPQHLTDEIEETIRELDQEEAADATGTVTSIVRVGGDVNGSLIAERLGTMISDRAGRQDERQVRQDPRRSRGEIEQRAVQIRGNRDAFRNTRGRDVRRTVPSR